MGTNRQKSEDIHVCRIRDKLIQEYGSRHPQARIDVKRSNSVCVDIRIIDPDFARKRWRRREDMVWPVLETLPEDSFIQISFLALLTPEETDNSPLNFEFEDPLPPGIDHTTNAAIRPGNRRETRNREKPR